MFVQLIKKFLLLPLASHSWHFMYKLDPGLQNYGINLVSFCSQANAVKHAKHIK